MSPQRLFKRASSSVSPELALHQESADRLWSHFCERVKDCSRALLLVLLASVIVTALSQGAAAQSLNFDNNFFVTGDYVVAGAYNINQTVVNGMTTGTITVPDTKNPAGQANVGNTGATSVPAGAQIVAAMLFWETVESVSATGSGQNGSFAVPGADPGTWRSYPITGVNLTGNNNVSWSNGGCPGTSTGRTVGVYRADVRPYLPQDANGNTLPNTTYQVTLPSSTSGAPPITLGATLVIIYRVLSPSVPLNSIVIYDGAYGQTSSQLTMSQIIQGFYDADDNAVSRLTHIVGSGQANKYQSVYLNNVQLPNLYGGQAAFPGWYGTFDNPTWTFDPKQTWIPLANPVTADASSATTTVVPNPSQQGCVVWGATILSTTVKDTDHDGLLNSWEDANGYCDASVTSQSNPPRACGGQSDPAWVPLPGALNGPRDVFVQLDYMCSAKVAGQNACNTTPPNYSYDPSLTKAPDGKTVVEKVQDAFAATTTKQQGINLHVEPTWAIQEQTCTDSSTALCAFPNQPGVVGWKGGLVQIKNQLLKNDGSGDLCTDSTGATCIPRFQRGRKDSWHYALFAHALGQPKWGFLNGLTNSTGAPAPGGEISQSGTTVTIYTSTAHGLVAYPAHAAGGNDRVTISDAISNLNLNGTFPVLTTKCPNDDCTVTNTAPGPYSFTIQVPSAASAQASYNRYTDPVISIAPGKTGTGSGFSDVGGEDSLIALGNWPLFDQTWNAKAGVFMHELGHSLGLTHGGLYYDKINSKDAFGNTDYTPTSEANCKPNFLSVMNYAFTVDLLDNTTLDYAGEILNSLNESIPPAATLSSQHYTDTVWYAPTGAGDPRAAARHCDGTPILDGAHMMRMMGPMDSASCNGLPACTSFSYTPPQDVNFDGTVSQTVLRGHDDWDTSPASPGIDLRQIGATGTLSTSGGPLSAGGGPLSAGGGPLSAGGGPLSAGGGPLSAGGGPLSAGGGPGELTHETANSFARPPLSVSALEGLSPRIITVSWNLPIFGTPDHFDIYRSSTGPKGTFTKIATVPAGSPPQPSYSYADTVTCNPVGYIYYVTSTVFDDFTGQALTSQPSNATTSTQPLTGCYTNTPPSVALNDLAFPTALVKRGTVIPITWTLQADNSLAYTNPYANNLKANTLTAIGPTAYTNNTGVCAPYTTTTPKKVLLASGTVTTASKSTYGVSAGPNYQFAFNWNSTGFSSGCYYFELRLDSGQIETSGPAVPLK